MADANPDLDLGGAPADGQEKSGGGNLKLIIIVAVVALALGAGAAWFMVPKGEPVAEGEEVAAEQSAEQDTTEPESAEQLPESIYYDLGQEFISNLQDYGFVRMKASVMSFDQVQIDKVNHNKAAILHEVLSLLRAHSFDKLSTTEGQESLRMAIKEKVQEIIRAGDSGGIEEVYLTDFILQQN